jgi:hypothetical protein
MIITSNEIEFIVKKKLSRKDTLLFFKDVGFSNEEAILATCEYFNIPVEGSKNLFLRNIELMIIVVAIFNEGWEPNWNDPSQYKYFPRFNLSEGFSFYYAINYITSTTVPSALYIKDEATARYVGKEFVDIYEGFIR